MGIWAIELMAKRYQDLSKLDIWHLPLADLANAAGVPSAYFDAIIANPRMSPFWDERSPLAAYDKVRIPVLHWSGWYDCYLGPTLEDWQVFREKNAGRQTNHLFIGPWDHEGTPDVTHRAGLLPVARTTAEHRWSTFVAFFDRYLGGFDDSFGKEGLVHYFVLGADEWRHAPTWPPAESKPIQLYLGAGGELSDVKPGEETADRYDYDPRKPVAWTAGIDCWAFAEGMGDRQSIERRPDVLSFTTTPLLHHTDIVGALSAKLWVTSTAPSTDFVVALCDVFPDGRVNLIQNGILRTTEHAAYRADTAILLEIDLWSTAYRIDTGHRLRLEITSSDFNRFDRNPNTAAPFGHEASPAVAHQTILHDASHASWIEFSVA